MENEIELLNQTEADLLMLMQQYQSGQYVHLADCIRRVRVVRETLRHPTQQLAAGEACQHCNENDWRECMHGIFCGFCQSPRR